MNSVSIAAKFFSDKGYSPAATAGIVGNLMHESRLNPTIVERNPGNHPAGVGIAQWDPSRLAALGRFAASKNADPNNLLTQLAFVDHELNTTEKSSGNRVRAAQDPTEATAAMLGYERPQGWRGPGTNPDGVSGWQNRLAGANKVYGMLVGGSISPDDGSSSRTLLADSRPVSGTKLGWDSSGVSSSIAPTQHIAEPLPLATEPAPAVQIASDTTPIADTLGAALSGAFAPKPTPAVSVGLRTGRHPKIAGTRTV